MADALEAAITGLQSLAHDPLTSGSLRGQISELAAEVAMSTGASVRVIDVGGVTARFAGRNAAQAGQMFSRLAAERAAGWAEQVAQTVVGRLS